MPRTADTSQGRGSGNKRGWKVLAGLEAAAAGSKCTCAQGSQS